MDHPDFPSQSQPPGTDEPAHTMTAQLDAIRGAADRALAGLRQAQAGETVQLEAL